MKKDEIIAVLKQYDIPEVELNRYSESHRFYHTLEHVSSMLLDAKKLNILTDELFLAIVFHDIIYNPKANDNEERSAELLYRYVPNETIKEAILETKTHQPKTELGKQLCELDLAILKKDFTTFIDFEEKIFKEYQWVDHSIYKKKRVAVLSKLGVKPEWIDYVKCRKPNIAVYPGSFNPFHKGHYNVLEKAEKIFDKVIIARGINPEKKNKMVDLPEALQHRQVENYDGLLTDFIDSLDYDVTLIRGLRNTTDFQYELNQYRFLQDLKPDIKVVSLFCDKEFDHISSSAIRQLKQLDHGGDYEL